MPNDLTPRLTTSPLALLTSRSFREINAALAEPVDQAKLARALRDLLGLYWVAADAPEERARQIALFVKDLSKFSEAVVAYAIHEWRTREDRRPSIASLHQLCSRRQFELLEHRDRLIEAERVEPAPQPMSEGELEERRIRVEGILQDSGFTKRREGWIMNSQAAEERVKEEARAPHWSETAAPDDPRWAAVRKAREANPLMRGLAFGDAGDAA